MGAPELIEVHEDRLSRLEDQSREVSNLVAAQGVQIDGLSDKVTTAFDSLDYQLQALHLKLDGIGTTLSLHRDEIASLKRDAALARTWTTRIGAALAAVIGYVASAFVKKHVG